MPVKNFADVVANVETSEEAFERELARSKPAERNYVIMFTPRSGSSWLTSILSGVMGFPEEYINPQFLPSVASATNSREQSGILSILKRRRKTENDIFGIEATSTQISIFGEPEFFDAFDRETIYFWLWRDNLIAQGISLYKAVSTQHFHSSDPTQSAEAPKEFDLNEVRRWINHILHIENENLKIADRRGLEPRFIRYEDIVRSKAATMTMFADALRVRIGAQEAAKPRDSELKRIGDAWNVMVETEFRDKEHKFVEELEFRRLVKAH